MVLLWATEERLSKLLLAALMMIEDLKAWAVACRLHRIRQMESGKVFLAPSTAHKGVASNGHTVQMSTDIHSTHTLHPLKNVSTEGHLLPNMPVQLGKAVTTTPAVAAFCREKRLQADVAIALALEACDAVYSLCRIPSLFWGV